MLNRVLVRKDDFDGEPLSFAETHRHSALYKPKSTSGATDERIEQGIFYNITAVVTPLAHRRRGYATHLMKLLHYTLLNPSSPGDPPSHIPPFPIEWGSPPPAIPDHLAQQIPSPIAATLWADIDPSFYERCTIGNVDGTGYNYHADWNRVCTFDLLPPASVNSQNEPEEYQWNTIHLKKMDEVKATLHDSIYKSIQRAGDSPKTIFTQDPTTAGALTYIGTRASFVDPRPEWATKIRAEQYPLGIKSIKKTKDGNDEEESIVLFALESFYLGEKFLITKIDDVQSDQIGSMVAELDKINHETGAKYSQAEFWGIDPDSTKWFESLQRECERSGRSFRTGIRSGEGKHVLAVCDYTQPGKDGFQMQDTQMWNWV
uniref:N-acetyltransferase domain-containing protein n=1 Tax=Kwoniella dejecticola CBS 10117 TaxID=1296121 RepID=A0A1A6AHJ2_9TREE|nr:uncharacterized protein I303_01310 [Kwoniella dejecticola CBS 10117]OBR89483.1 hypothetical protein I303_01310 [Kwoniella dejecticola CBS 10117]